MKHVCLASMCCPQDAAHAMTAQGDVWNAGLYISTSISWLFRAQYKLQQFMSLN